LRQSSDRSINSNADIVYSLSSLTDRNIRNEYYIATEKRHTFYTYTMESKPRNVHLLSVHKHVSNYVLIEIHSTQTTQHKVLHTTETQRNESETTPLQTLPPLRRR
jgi:hypothetical protein